MSRATSWAGSALLRLLWSLHPDDWSNGPRPEPRSEVRAVGEDPVRILMFGGGPFVGYGVRTHDLALPGHLARMLATRLGRSVEIDVVTAVDLTAAGAVALAESIDTRAVTAVIVAIGVQDAMQFTALAGWQKDVERMLDVLAESRCPNRSPIDILIVGVPPVSSIASLPAIGARILDARSDALNDRLVALAAQRPDSTFVPFQPPRHGQAARHRESSTYREWAALIAPAVEQWLSHSTAWTPSAQTVDVTTE